MNLPSDWKDSVSTYSKIASTYPNPKDGWTVNVQDTDYTYRYNGTDWIAISANAIPKATSSTDGLFSKEDYGRFELMCSESISIQQPYAVCNESMGTQAKTVSMPKFILTTGAKVTVKFPNGNSAASPTLNVSGTGAKEIYYNGAPISRNYIKRESVHDFVYDGTHWLMEGEKGAGYYHVTCTTAADQKEKSVVLAGFRLVNGAQLILQFTHGNTAENPTLNVQNTGAYPIYYGGSPISWNYITENSAVQLVFDGQNKWVVVGNLTGYLLDEIQQLKEFVGYKGYIWREFEKDAIRIQNGGLYIIEGAMTQRHISYYSINTPSIGNTAIVNIDTSYDADYKVVTHFTGEPDISPRDDIFYVPPVIAANGNTEIYTFTSDKTNNTSEIVFNSSSIRGATCLYINYWGSPSDFKIYKKIFL